MKWIKVFVIFVFAAIFLIGNVKLVGAGGGGSSCGVGCICSNFQTGSLCNRYQSCNTINGGTGSSGTAVYNGGCGAGIGTDSHDYVCFNGACSGGGGGGCSNTAPAVVSLTSPTNGGNVSVTKVSLQWSAESSWGTACSGANNQYQVYVGTANPPTTLVATVASGTTSTNFTGTRGTKYYWKVVANNGQATSTSSVWRFTILDNHIAGTVYNDPNNTCSQATPWSGGGTVTVGSNKGTIGADGKYSVTAPTGASYNVSLGMPVGYTCSTGAICGICPDRSGISSPSTGNNFFITNNKAGWWQAAGAPVYAGSAGGGVTVRSQLPNALTDLILPGTGGTAGVLLRSTGIIDIGLGLVSPDGWSTKSTYHGKTMNYDYFAAQMGVTKNQSSDWLGTTLDKPVNDPTKDFWDSPATSEIASPWSVASGESYVVFVNGNLNIKNNITVANGGFLAFMVSGNIIVDPSVTDIEGIYLSNGNFTTQSIYSLGVTNDAQLTVQGSVVAWGNMDLRRNLGGAGNINPGELFSYRPDLLSNMPAKLKTFAMQWQEVPAGTF